ncbi:Alpha/Beta hydrolase protein [Aspergillus karnatakaensis]|uniref:alpha/beta fold hydrolase n=1 Tax=Aspergillus karnatakaensis TaxID=1810916 RepID=UPI003CCDB7E2
MLLVQHDGTTQGSPRIFPSSLNYTTLIVIMSSLFVPTSPDTTLRVRITRPSTPTNKPLLLFIHYWGGTSSTWYRVVSGDAPSSIPSRYPTAAVDLRGWGKSTGPTEDTGNPFSSTLMARDMVRLVTYLQVEAEYTDILENGFVLIGHSMGAKVAMATLSALTDQLLNKLQGLVLIAPAPPTALILPPEMKEQQAVAYSSEESVRWTVTNVLAQCDLLSAGDLDMIVSDSLGGSDLAKRAWPNYGMAEDITDDVKRVLAGLGSSLQVRVLAGELDIVEPEHRVQEEVCRFLKNIGVEVSLRTVPGVRHLIPLECPEAIVEEISYF